MKLEQLTENQIQQFCKENPDTEIAKTCQSKEGFEEVKQRSLTLLENDFKNQKITIEELCWWLEQNEFDADL